MKITATNDMKMFIYILQWLLRFPLPLFIAEAMFIPYLKRKKNFPIRFFISSVVFFFLTCIVVFFDKYMHIDWFYFSFLIVFLLSLLPMFCSLDVTMKHVLFYAMSAYSIQNSVDSVCSLCCSLLSVTNKWMARLVSLICYLACYPIYFFIFVNKVKDTDFANIKSKRMILTFGLTLLSVYVLSMFAFVSDDAPNSYSTRLLSILCDILLLCLQFDIFRRNKTLQETYLLKQVIEKKNEMDKRYKEDMELINIKCHDLKHNIKALRMMAQTDAERNYIKELEKSVMFFETNIKTGNETLDVLLSEKALICQKENIRYSFIVNGGLLDFMNEMDLHSLFGNALDNAIEALRASEIDKRIIVLDIRREGNYVSIKQENHTSEKVKFDRFSYPITNKNDKQFHGYGTKSMIYIVKQYNGEITFRQIEDRFIINIHIPIPKDENKKQA